jgi:chorismate mutase
MNRLFALRGAVCVENDADDIRQKVAAVYDDLLEKNGLSEDAIVSLIFSVTADIDAKNPAAALRESGRGGELSLFSTQEPAIKGGLPRTIRLLLHCYMDETANPRHAYLAGAEVLRPDRAKS